MLFHIVKHRIAALILIITAAASSGLTACTANNSASVPVATPTAQPTKAAENPNGMMSHGMSHSSMDLGVADADYDLRFLDGMTPHHQGAIAMAEDVLKNSQRPELKKLAQEIIQAQKKEIAQMAEWRKAWYPTAGEKLMMWHAESNHMMEMTPEFRRNMMMSVDLGRADDKFDLRFLDAMIPHHEGALVMAKDAIAKSKRPEIQKMAQEILSSQQAEIDQMKQLRK
ncbi:MAG: DUF305 domain-containing protein [Pseudanabaena sp. Salubria-1]|jgi:uncharacterized protein (DUF305 family)|nr:DUF305 domain-containing protein [Pseudanabaena sp. Salubria-1]